MSPIRRSFLAAAAPALASAAVLSGAAPPVAARSDAASDPEVAQLVLRATQAHDALMRGDLARYRSLIAVTDDFLLMAPFGGTPTRGADLTEERWVSVGRFFRNGREASAELLQAWRTPDMVVLALIERGHVEVGGLAGQDWALRVTLVFRRENDRWLLAHRHADPLVHGVRLEQAAALARERSPA